MVRDPRTARTGLPGPGPIGSSSWIPGHGLGTLNENALVLKEIFPIQKNSKPENLLHKQRFLFLSVHRNT